jgi:hypothetical protein
MTILPWTISHNDKTKTGWCFDDIIESAIEAVKYQSPASPAELKHNCSVVNFYKSGKSLGTYYFESDEFYPSSYYDDNPEIAKL